MSGQIYDQPDFIREIDECRRTKYHKTPRSCGSKLVSLHQRNFAPISYVPADVNAIMAPPISDLSPRVDNSGFEGIKGVEGTRFHEEIERLGQFIIDYVVSGELDRIYTT